jgi:hypothetical protein
MMRSASPRRVPVPVRVAASVGASSWLVTFVALTGPDTFDFAPQIAGGVLVTVAIAGLLDRVLRRARVLEVALAAVVCLGAAAVASYWAGVVAPALRARAAASREAPAPAGASAGARTSG